MYCRIRKISGGNLHAVLSEPRDILLFHDYTCPGENTLHALEKIIPELLSRGYRFVTVEEMFAVSEN